MIRFGTCSVVQQVWDHRTIQYCTNTAWDILVQCGTPSLGHLLTAKTLSTLVSTAILLTETGVCLTLPLSGFVCSEISFFIVSATTIVKLQYYLTTWKVNAILLDNDGQCLFHPETRPLCQNIPPHKYSQETIILIIC